MTYPCGMIRDLLPLYLEGLCGPESCHAVETHLKNCPDCTACLEAMETAGPDKPARDEGERRMEHSLKQVKDRLTRRYRRVLLGAAAAVAVVALGFQVLFGLPLKSVAPRDVQVTAEVYPLSEIAKDSQAEGDTVKITLGMEDDSDTYDLEIPAMPNANITISADVAEQNGYLTVICWSSPYFLREIRWGEKPDGDERTLYVEALRTTLLNNRSTDLTRSIETLEFRQVDRVVFLEKDGSETLLWSR